MMIPTQTLEEISSRVNILEVIGRYVQIRRSGSSYVALCPFHHEKTPSMHIDPDKGLWHCFGCKEGGSVFQFVMKMEASSFYETACKLASEVGIEIDVSQEAQEAESERGRALSLLERTASYYQEVLQKSSLGIPGRDYLIKRGISRDIAMKFRLGFAPSTGTSLLRKLNEAGYKENEAVECGVAMEHDYGARDLMRGRLIFPIADAQGRILAFGGRDIADGMPKYLNSPETKWYSKRRHLYGLNLARGPISRSERGAVLVEGYFDVVSFHQVGVDTAVASLGTAFTQEQAQLLHRYNRNVILSYDADSAGEQATIKGCSILEDQGLRVLVATMPKGEDPDSMARQGSEVVEKLLDNAGGIVNFQMERLKDKIDLASPEGKEDFIREVLPFVERIKDSARQDAYVRKLAYFTGVTEAKLHWRLRSRGRGYVSGKASRMLSVEERLFCLCVAKPGWIHVASEIVEPQLIRDEGLRSLFPALFALGDLERIEPVSIAELMPRADDEKLLSRVAELLTQPLLSSTEDDMRKLAESVRDEALRERLDVLKKEVLPALDAGILVFEDPLCQEYYQLRRYFHGRGVH